MKKFRKTIPRTTPPPREPEMMCDHAEAGIFYVDDAGRYTDFRSLRHTIDSLLAASGARPKVAQSIVRHSDINLTMSRYTHTLRGQESKAIENLPDLSVPSRKQKAAATGTDDLPIEATQNVSEKLTPKLTPTAHSGYNRLAAVDNEQ